ncbi:UNVERIFIED_CONTAM: hypothetical protein PYX00_011832 [Menopon gallinae]|uniref:DNA polymerase epsilon catalytic subunit n=1 Tax=Menopon gallinae TaxID=328185 RepID=A0AAW2H8M2_9NEOP
MAGSTSPARRKPPHASWAASARARQQRPAELRSSEHVASSHASARFPAYSSQEPDGDIQTTPSCALRLHGTCLSKQDSLLAVQFGYVPYYEQEQRRGWLLNHQVTADGTGALFSRLYFIDEKGGFTCTIPYFPSFLVEAGQPDVVEEYLKKRFEGVYLTETVERTDTSTFNHLNMPTKTFVKVYFYTENAFSRCLTEIRGMVRRRRGAEVDETIFNDFLSEDIGLRSSMEALITGVYEYDIPFEMSVLIEMGLRCGNWYLVRYDEETYFFRKEEGIAHYPEMRVLAFDIETTKKPLKFPNPEYDEIMMISAMCDSQGYLIVNRAFVAEDISDFEYSPSNEIRGDFRIYNEPNEEALLIRFYELLQGFRPHLATTYNGSLFDFPFIEKRTARYNLSLSSLTGFVSVDDTFSSPFVVHLDCYKWVRRDSYLPMGSQGLKSVAKIKLGYFPDEIDPERIMEHAVHDPHKLASYSVSDAVATYYLFVKYVKPFIFSLCTLIPFGPVPVLNRGSGTLCEALLLAEAHRTGILIPDKKRESGPESYKGHFVENCNYVGGHVECLRTGIFRSDFTYEFRVNVSALRRMGAEKVVTPKQLRKIEAMLEARGYAGAYRLVGGEHHEEDAPDEYLTVEDKPVIYHLDVGAMYPNIILTNRLQPIAIKTEDDCMRCDYRSDGVCQKRMDWELRTEYYPPTKEEVDMVRAQLEKEYFVPGSISVADGARHGSRYRREDRRVPAEASAGVKVRFGELSKLEQSAIFKKRLAKYSQKIYRRSYVVETSTQSNVVCQREIPFYLDTVLKFRDQRYNYKKLSKVESPFRQIYESLQIAHKVILNSFYGYTMRRGSRWYSMEMAAIVCHCGKRIIMEARQFIEQVGIALEVDTDGIWCMLPSSFPIEVDGANIFVMMLNKVVANKFTNHQYQIADAGGEAGSGGLAEGACAAEEIALRARSALGKEDLFDTDGMGEPRGRRAGKKRYRTVSYNSIFFEIDGPYRAIVLPASVEEHRLTKKKYVVFNFSDRISELKGFETKRRGELNFIKKFQEDLFSKFTLGDDLRSCYQILGRVANYWLDIIQLRAEGLSEEEIFYLFSESKSMSKGFDAYEGRKALNTCTAEKLAELGVDLEPGMKCEFIISAYPENEPVALRAIPTSVFHMDRARAKKHLAKWLRRDTTDVRQILDWGYYEDRFRTVVQKLVCIPANAQGIDNPVERIALPRWASRGGQGETIERWFVAGKREARSAETLRVGDIEETPACRAPEAGTLHGDYSSYLRAKQKEWVHGFRGLERSRQEELLEIDTERQVVRFKQRDVLGSRPLVFRQEYFLVPVHTTHVGGHGAGSGSEDTGQLAESGMSLEAAAECMGIGCGQLRRKSLYMANTPSPVTVYLSPAPTDHPAFVLHDENAHRLVYENPRIFSTPTRCVLATAFSFKRKTVYALTESGRTTFHMEGRDTQLASNIHRVCYNSDIERVLDAYASTHILVHNDSFNKPYRGLRFNARIASPLPLVGFGQLLEFQIKLHAQMKERYDFIDMLSIYTRIPLANVDDDALDHMYFRILKDRDILCIDRDWVTGNALTCGSAGGDSTRGAPGTTGRQVFLEPPPDMKVLKDSLCVPGYYDTVCAEIECMGSLVLGVLEHEFVLGRDSLYDGVERNDFKALFSLFRKLYLDSTENGSAMHLLKQAERWVRSSRLTRGLLPVLSLLKTRYLIGLVGVLRKLKIDVVAVNKDMICLKLEKKWMLGYLEGKIRESEGYSMVRLSVVRMYKKLIYVSPVEWFFVEDRELDVCDPLKHSGSNGAEGAGSCTLEDGGACKSTGEGSGPRVMCFSQAKVPSDFLKMYFSGQKISPNYFYSMAIRKSVPCDSIVLMLKIMGLREDCSVLRANCFKLLKLSEFGATSRVLARDVICRRCGLDNVFRVGMLNMCYKCFRRLSTTEIEETLMEIVREMSSQCRCRSAVTVCECFVQRRGDWAILQGGCRTSRYERFLRGYAPMYEQ